MTIHEIKFIAEAIRDYTELQLAPLKARIERLELSADIERRATESQKNKSKRGASL